jgi:hypothetical protein
MDPAQPPLVARGHEPPGQEGPREGGRGGSHAPAAPDLAEFGPAGAQRIGTEAAQHGPLGGVGIEWMVTHVALNNGSPNPEGKGCATAV